MPEGAACSSRKLHRGHRVGHLTVACLVGYEDRLELRLAYHFPKRQEFLPDPCHRDRTRMGRSGRDLLRKKRPEPAECFNKPGPDGFRFGRIRKRSAPEPVERGRVDSSHIDLFDSRRRQVCLPGRTCLKRLIDVPTCFAAPRILPSESVRIRFECLPIISRMSAHLPCCEDSVWNLTMRSMPTCSSWVMNAPPIYFRRTMQKFGGS